MKMTNGLMKLSTAAVVIGVTACSSNYVKPEAESQIVSQDFIEKKSFEVWNVMLKKLTASGFTVKNLDNESGTMSLIYKSKKAGAYVDCGQLTISANEKHKIREHTFNPADSALYSSLDGDGQIQNIVRTSALTARTSIFLASSDDGTSIRMNVTYDISGRTKYYDADNHFTNSDKFRYKLSSTEGYDGDAVVCQSKGVIEKMVLEAVQ